MDSLQKFLSLIVFFAVSVNSYSQEEISLSGQVLNSENDISDILVINLNSYNTTITDYKGQFIIKVKQNDTVQLRAFQFVSKKIIISDTIFKQKKVTIELKENVIELDEVTISPYKLSGNLAYDVKDIKLKPTVTASSLGLPKLMLDL